MTQITDLGLCQLPLAALQLPEGDMIAWVAVGAAILAPLFTIILLFFDRRGISRKLTMLDEAVRRTASAQQRSMEEAEPWEATRERVVLGNMLDSFPEVTQKFVKVANIEDLGRTLLSAFGRVLGSKKGLVFVRQGETLRLIAREGVSETECANAMKVRIGEGRAGYAAEKCLILSYGDFAQLDRADRLRIDQSERLEGNFDYYIPMIYRGRAIGCVVVGGIGRVINKARAAGMAVANLGSLVLTSILRERQVRTLSEQDPLTQLSNRRHCYELLAERMEAVQTSPFAVFLFDIDNFKSINDEYGHAVGDEVLRQLADVTRDMVRPEEDEFAARVGGEEFLCVVGCEDVAALAARLEDFRLSVSKIVVDTGPDAGPPAVRISGGVAFCPAEEDDADALVRIADDRLYAAKKSGRDRVFLESGPPKSRRHQLPQQK